MRVAVLSDIGGRAAPLSAIVRVRTCVASDKDRSIDHRRVRAAYMIVWMWEEAATMHTRTGNGTYEEPNKV